MASCPVCLDYVLREQELRLACSHTFHKECILAWLREHKECPVCRAAIEEAFAYSKVLQSFEQEVLSFEYENRCSAVEFSKCNLVKNTLFEEQLPSCDVFAVSPQCYAYAKKDVLTAVEMFDKTEYKYEQSLKCNNASYSVQFKYLEFNGNFLYAVSAVQLVILNLLTKKQLFELTFEQPCLEYNEPFYLLTDGLYLLQSNALTKFHQITSSMAYKFDYSAEYYVFAQYDGTIVLKNHHDFEELKLQVGNVSELLIQRGVFAVLEDSLLKIFDFKGNLLNFFNNISHISKNEEGMIVFNKENSIFQIEV